MEKNTVETIKHDLEKAVFRSLYGSLAQRLLRFLGIMMIATKHGLRGLLYVWPLALLVFIELPGNWAWLKLFLLVLAAAAWIRFIFGSVRDDYQRFLSNRILKLNELYRIL